MINNINICAFLEQFNREYEYLYDHHDHVAGYDEAVDSFDAFLKLEMCMYQLNEAYNDKYGYYIQNEDRGLVTLTSFVRSIKPETKYYFGGTVDYHF